MKVELHCHTSRYSPCAKSRSEDMMAALIAAGYEAVYITEHDVVWREADINRLQAAFPKIKIFPGIEKTIGGKDSFQHLLILGTVDQNFIHMIDSREILDKARKLGHLTVLAHPFRWRVGANLIYREGLMPDAIECRTASHDAEMAEESTAAAKRFNLRMVNCGDSHSPEFLNRAWIETDRPIVQANDIRQIILDGAYKAMVGQTPDENKPAVD
ncbi:MAG: PHP domain-containing protein [Planctomycetes bacterium]|nr:PHP domain-containing protein [Planctomycetota bacterium]